MKRINLLDANTANKIAAGEVVERPFSVVKELIENSIDANAKNITIEIEEGGQKKIKIVDDGDGIHEEDIEKAFMAHATSKISTIEDVYSINTMGFRGEALASIAAVSKITLKSRTRDKEFGAEISVSGGYQDYLKVAPCNVGTTIEVCDLFYNVPARLKFMKTKQGESGAISDIVNRIALANPSISFTLISNNKKTLKTFGTGNILDTILNVYGKEISANLISFENHDDIVCVSGFVGNSEISRGSRNNQSIFVNKRYIKNKLIGVAVENAFKSFLTINKFPFFIVNIDIYPEYLDVNVHPTKSEVKFKDDRQIFKIVFDGVHKAIRESLSKDYYGDFQIIGESNEAVPCINTTDSVNKKLIEKSISFLDESKTEINSDIFSNCPSISSGTLGDFSNIKLDLKKDMEVIKSEIINKDYTSEIINEVGLPLDLKIDKNLEHNVNVIDNIYINDNKNVNDNMKTNDCIFISETEKVKTAKFGALRVIGQFSNTYILAEGMDGLYLIDQHAAHEKVIFEKYIENIKNREIVAQILIIPEVIELSLEDFDCFMENINLFTNTGFNIENFGDNTISIREVPMLFGKPSVKPLFMDILDNLKNMGTGKTTEVKYGKIASLACKAAVKGNDCLSTEEMKSLIEDLRYIDEPFTCPHGRPTIIKMTLNELEKKFKRIQ